MTLADIVVIIAALFIGYKLTTMVMTEPKEKAAPASPPPRPVTGKRPWFEVLNVSPQASREQVVEAYRRLIREYHPDRVATMGQEFRDLAERRASEINVAYAEAMERLG